MPIYALAVMPTSPNCVAAASLNCPTNSSYSISTFALVWLDAAFARHSISKPLAHRMLSECTKLQDAQLGRRVNSLMLRSGLDSVSYLANCLVRLFASGGNIAEANYVFDRISKPDQYTWNAIISGHAKLGKSETALHLYYTMTTQDAKPDKFTFPSILRACSSTRNLTQGRSIHNRLIVTGLQSDVVVGSSLLDMYAKSGCLEEARKVFDSLPNQDVVSWSAIISGYAQQGEGLFALECYETMLQKGIKPDKMTFSSTLKACSILGVTEKGRHIHEQILEKGLQLDLVVGSILIDMYAKCACLEETRKVFDHLPNGDVILWGTMIEGYAMHGEGHLALECFVSMQQRGIKSDRGAFLSALKACTCTGAIYKGRQVHEEILQSELHSDVMLGSTLVDMYAKCKSLREAQKSFDRLAKEDVIARSTMIAAYAEYGEGLLALQCFQSMKFEGLGEDNTVTFLSRLKACGSICALPNGRYVHEQMIDNEVQSGEVAGSILIDVYAKCRSLEEARLVFSNLVNRTHVSWGAMIAGYAQHGEGYHALECFNAMKGEDIKPGKAAFLSTLKVCGNLNNIEQGRHIHQEIIECGFQSDNAVGNTLLDMYSKCGKLDEARVVFDGIVRRDVVSWNVMIAGYAKHGEGLLAVDCFENMQQDGIAPSKVTFLVVLNACGTIGAIEEGRQIQEQFLQFGLQSDIILGNALIDMHAKCGSLKEAWRIFNNLPNKDAISWHAMIAGYAQNGDAEFAVQCFENMQQSGIKVDAVALNLVLTGFCRVGLVEEAMHHFKTMKDFHSIEPDLYHVTCLVDLLGRQANFVEAGGLVKDTLQPDLCLWTTFLSACEIHKNVTLGGQCFNAIVNLDPHYDAGYVLMSNAYATALKMFIE